MVVLVNPQASVAVNITVADPVSPQSSLKAVKSLAQVTVPEQSSEAAPVVPIDVNQLVRSVTFPDPSHSTVKLDAAVSIVGTVVSSIVKVAVVVLVNPQASVAVKVTRANPVSPQSSLKVVKSLVQVTPEQASEATPVPPIEVNQLVRSVTLPDPSHSTTKLDAAVSIVGAVVSCMVKVASCVIKFPLPSSNVKVTVSVPVAPHKSLKPVLLLVTVAEQLSVPEKLTNQAANAPLGSAVPSHCTVLSAGAFTQVGTRLSITLTVIGNALFTVFPFTSLILICLLFIPISAQVKVLFARPP